MRSFFINKPVILLVFPIIVFILHGCSNTLESPEITGTEFFPLEIGRFIEYDIEERIYSTTSPVQVLNYQIREEIAESFLDIENEVAYRLERFRREQSTQPWELDSVWTVKKTVARVLRTENNVTFVKLVFPPNERTTWNGNAFNNLGEEEYRIVNLGESSSVDTMSFSNTLKVIQNDLCSLVSLDNRNEEYAEGVGLIYKEDWKLSISLLGTCPDSIDVYCNSQIIQARPPLPFENCIEFGRIFTQKIIAYGKN